MLIPRLNELQVKIRTFLDLRTPWPRELRFEGVDPHPPGPSCCEIRLYPDARAESGIVGRYHFGEGRKQRQNGARYQPVHRAASP